METMREQAFAWVCELVGCGHRWLAVSDVAPRQCAKCKRVGWHQTRTMRELVREGSADGALPLERLDQVERRLSALESPRADLAPSQRPEARPMETPAYPSTTPNAPEVLPPPAKAQTIDSLRHLIDATMHSPAPIPQHSATIILPPCTYAEYDPETGETYACGLTEHPAKIPHTRGHRL